MFPSGMLNATPMNSATTAPEASNVRASCSVDGKISSTLQTTITNTNASTTRRNTTSRVRRRAT